MTDLPEDLRRVIHRELGRCAARGIVHRLFEQRWPDAGTRSLYPYQRDMIRRAREVWAGQYPTIRATTESTMTDRRETDTATATLLGNTLRVSVARYNDDTGRVDVTTDRNENWSRFPVSGAEARAMIRSIREGRDAEAHERIYVSASEKAEQIPSVRIRSSGPGIHASRISAGGLDVAIGSPEESPWIENDGTIPVEQGTLVDVQWRNGEVHHRQEAGRPGSRAMRWRLRNGFDDIVTWRLSADAEEQGGTIPWVSPAREGRTPIDFEVQGDRIKVYATGEHGYGLSVEGISVLHDVTGEQMARMVRDLRSWLDGDKDRWTDGHRLFVEEDSDADICIYRIADNGGRGEKLLGDLCQSGFREAVEMLDGRLSVIRSKGDEQTAEPLHRAAEDYHRAGSPSPAETWLANPGERPVEADTRVDVKHRDGDVFRSIPARHQCWSDAGNGTIVAWRRSETGTNPGEDDAKHPAPFAPNPGHQPPGVHSDTRVDVVFEDGGTHQDAPARFWKWDHTLLGWRYAQDEQGTEDASPDGRPTEAHGLIVVDQDEDGRPMIEVPRSRLGLGGHGPGEHRCWPLHIDRLLDTGGGNWLRVQLEGGMTVRMSRMNPSDDCHQRSQGMVDQLADLGLSGASDVWIRFVDREADAPTEDHCIPNPQPLRRTPEVMDLVRTIGSDGKQAERTVRRVDQEVSGTEWGRIATTVYVRGLGRMGFMWDEGDQRFQHKPLGGSDFLWLAEPAASSEDAPTDPPPGYRYVQHVPRIGERVLSVSEGDNDLIDRTVTQVEEDVDEPTKVAINGLMLNWFVWNEEHQRFQQGPNVIYLVQRDRR